MRAKLKNTSEKVSEGSSNLLTRTTSRGPDAHVRTDRSPPMRCQGASATWPQPDLGPAAAMVSAEQSQLRIAGSRRKTATQESQMKKDLLISWISTAQVDCVAHFLQKFLPRREIMFPSKSTCTQHLSNGRSTFIRALCLLRRRRHNDFCEFLLK
jgi:hypothetical protein